MHIIDDTHGLMKYRQSLGKKTVALVPTMGNLHAGHLSLINLAKGQADVVVTSIFVNPLQFSPQEDFIEYPRSLEQDLDLLKNAKVDAVFTPHEDMLFPHGRKHHIRMHLPTISPMLCGVTRPHFFDGVLVIVNKLFNLVTPTLAVFGEKDLQQLVCIKQMVDDLCIPIQILSAPTVRDNQGLALSSRNSYLNEHDRKVAPQLYQALQNAREALLFDASHPEAICNQQIEYLKKLGFKPEYFTILDAATLNEINNKTEQIAILTAGTLGVTRLIDNIIFSAP